MSDSASVPSPRATPGRGTYLGILSLLAFSFMMFQIAVLRELRFQLTTLFTLTPFLFSSVIFCIALGSLFAGRIRSRSKDVLRWGATLLPVLAVPLFTASIGTAQGLLHRESSRFQYGPAGGAAAGDAYLSSTILAFLAVAVCGYGFMFFLQGLIFSLYFREGREEGTLSDVYGVDLLASGAGALAGGALSFTLSPVQMVLLTSGLFLANLCVSAPYLGIRRGTVAASAGVTTLLVVAELAGGILTRLETPHWMPPPTRTLWSRYRRIDAVETPGALEIYADGILFQLHDRTSRSHAEDPRTLTARLIQNSSTPVRDVLIVGAGSGSDVRILRDVVPGDLRITAVELDEGFVRTAAAFPWLWDRYRTSEIVIQEGRYFLENTPKDYDLVLYAYIDPQSAVGSIGVPDANFLYTDAGLRAAYARVRDGGYLLITRVFLVQQEAEFVRRMCSTLESAGIRADSARVYKRPGSFAWGYYGDLSSLHVLVRKGAPPPALREPDLVPLAWQPGERPTTDLFPFSLGTGIWFDTLLGYLKRHVPALVGSVGLALAVAGLAGSSLPRLAFFVLGFGSFLLESLVLFNSFLLFGDPNLSAAIAVGVFLFWNGIGSMLSTRLERSRWIYAAAPAAVLLYALTAPYLNAHTIAASVPVRSLAFGLHLSFGGIAAGIMFPVALRRFADRPVPALFFMDVIGCAMAPPLFWLSMSLTGVWLVIAAASGCYLAVCGLLAFRK